MYSLQITYNYIRDLVILQDVIFKDKKIQDIISNITYTSGEGVQKRQFTMYN